MTALITESFTGSNVAVNVHLETTRGPVIQEYLVWMAAFDIVLSQTDQTPSQLETSSFIKVDDVKEAIFELVKLAKEGKPDQIDPNDPSSPTMQFYMTTDMVSKFNTLIESLQVVGITVDFDAPTANAMVSMDGNQLRAWIDYAQVAPTVTTAVKDAVRAGGLANRTLQSMIELEYVRTGNELLSEKLEGLEESLTLTKDILDSLAELQEAHNQVSPIIPGSFPFDIFDGPDNQAEFVKSYLQAASAFFGTPIHAGHAPSGLFTGTFLVQNAQLLSELEGIQALLQQQAAELSAATIASGQTVDPNTLLGKLQDVLADLSRATSTPIAAFLWLTDGFHKPATSAPSVALADAGKIQQTITFAISAGEALNDKQKEEVRRFLFVFEEYYKSASSLLQKISQIIEKIAQGIART